DYLRRLNQPVQRLLRLRIEQTRVVWMDSDRGVDIVVSFSEGDRALEAATVRISGPDIQHRDDIGVLGPLYYCVAIGIEFCSVDMAVGIDKLHRGAPWHKNYLASATRNHCYNAASEATGSNTQVSEVAANHHHLNAVSGRFSNLSSFLTR